jgi:L-serine dehydratase
VDLGDDAHPNTAVLHVTRGDEEIAVRGSSLGGGRVRVCEIDGFPVELGGDYHTLVLLAHDEPGTIAAVATILSAHHINLATMRVDRTGRHQDALMTIEADEPVGEAALGAIRSFPWLRWARMIPKIA